MIQLLKALLLSRYCRKIEGYHIIDTQIEKVFLNFLGKVKE